MCQPSGYDRKNAATEPSAPMIPPPQNRVFALSVNRYTVAAGATSRPTLRMQPTACSDEISTKITMPNNA